MWVTEPGRKVRHSSRILNSPHSSSCFCCIIELIFSPYNLLYWPFVYSTHNPLGNHLKSFNLYSVTDCVVRKGKTIKAKQCALKSFKRFSVKIFLDWRWYEKQRSKNDRKTNKQKSLHDFILLYNVKIFPVCMAVFCSICFKVFFLLEKVR